MYSFTVKTTKKEYQKYNGCFCWATSKIREDGFIECYVPKHQVYILLKPKELSDD